MTGYCLLQARIDLSHHDSTSVGAHKRLSITESTNDPTIDAVPSAPPPADAPDEQTIDPQQHHLTCTPETTKTKAYRWIVRVENAGGKAYGKAIRLYNKHRRFSEQWNSRHPFLLAHNFEHAQ